MATNENPHIGTTFESWLDEQGIRQEVTAAVVKEIRHKPNSMRGAILETAFGLRRIGLLDAKTLRQFMGPRLPEQRRTSEIQLRANLDGRAER